MNARCSFLFILFGLLLSFQSTAQALTALDKKNGFRDAKLGSPLSAFKGMVKKPNDIFKWEDTYTRSSDALKLGDIPLKSIEYTFLNKKLSRITITYTSPSSNQPVFDALTSAYGQPIDFEEFYTNFEWQGELTNMRLFCGGKAGFGNITMDGIIIIQIINFEELDNKAAEHYERQKQTRRVKDL